MAFVVGPAVSARNARVARCGVRTAAAVPVAELDKCWVQPTEAPDTQASGLVVKSELNSKHTFAKVISVGAGEFMDNGENEPHSIEVGSHVLFDENTAREVTLDNQKYLVLRIKDVVASFDM